MADTVKTWRVARDQLKVGTSSRLFGQLIPEASQWPPHTQAAYERSGAIEKVFVSKEEFDEFVKEHPSTTSPVDGGSKKAKSKKTAKVKKRVVKKKTTAKKEQTSGEDEESREDGEVGDGAERELAEVSV